jgi:predicted transposase/invertase (TIGR01784 family)
MRDSRHPELRLCDDLCLYLFELPKFEKLVKAEWRGNSLNEWLHFFNHAREEDENMRNLYQSNAVRKAFSALEKLSADQKTRHLAEVREKALKNEVSMLGAAKREGRHEKAVETAKKLLNVGVLTSEQIAEVTGLSLEEVGLL